MDIRFINKNSKSPTHGAEIYGKSSTKPHYSPGGGEWGFSLIGGLSVHKQAQNVEDIISLTRKGFRGRIWYQMKGISLHKLFM